MRKLIFATFLLLTFNNGFSQDREYKFSFAMFADPSATEKDGFNFGASIDYQMTYVYFKMQTFVFPDLNDVFYLEVVGVPLGFNFHNKSKLYRIYTGLKLGVINRGGYMFPIYGFEGGLDLNVTKTFYIGLMASYDRRLDGTIWEVNADPYWRFSGFIKAGFRF